MSVDSGIDYQRCAVGSLVFRWYVTVRCGVIEDSAFTVEVPMGLYRILPLPWPLFGLEAR